MPAVPVKTAWFLMHEDMPGDNGRIVRVVGAKASEHDYLYGVSRVKPGEYPVSDDPPPYSVATAHLYDYWDYTKR